MAEIIGKTRSGDSRMIKEGNVTKDSNNKWLTNPDAHSRNESNTVELAAWKDYIYSPNDKRWTTQRKTVLGSDCRAWLALRGKGFEKKRMCSEESTGAF
jgi:sarcosine oxidase delta subunit